MGAYRRGRVWWIRYAGPNGENVRESTGQTDARAAERMERDRRREVALGTWHPRAPGEVTRPRVRDYAVRWIERIRARGLRTARDYDQRMREHVLPELGDRRLDELRPRDVIAFVTTLSSSGKLAPRSVHHVYDTLRSLCRDAVIDEVIAATPCVLPPGTLPKKKDADPSWRMTALFTRHELELLISDETTPWDRRVLYAIEGLAGLRFGEAVGRRWRDYDPECRPLGRLIVATQYDGRALKTEVPREVPVHPTLASILAEWKLGGWPAMMGREPRHEDLIIPSRRGAVRSVRHGHRRQGEDCERLEIPVRRQHDLRRTLISLARADGARTEVLKAITHGRTGAVIDDYTTWPWATLCEAIACLKVSRLGVSKVSVLRPVVAIEKEEAVGVYRRGRTAWIRYQGPDGLVRESTRQGDAREAERLYNQRKSEVAAGVWKDPRPLSRARSGSREPVFRPHAVPSRIYFLADGDDAVKIGTASDVAERVKSIQSLHHRPLRLLGTMQGGTTRERELHRRFASDRLAGEWFRLSVEVRAFITEKAEQHTGTAQSAEKSADLPENKATGERGGRDLNPKQIGVVRAAPLDLDGPREQTAALDPRRKRVREQ